MSVPIWVSTVALIIVLIMIVRAELKSTRRSKITLKETNRQINDLAQATFERHRLLFGKDATGTFPISSHPDSAKK